MEGSSTATSAASAASRRRAARCACACPTRGRRSSTTSIRGEARFEHVHLDDPVIARADGSVLYNFAVAIDDLDAGITHVVRGEDHLSNTPKQLLVFEALGATPPRYAHLPLLHGPDGKKLSKRHGAASVQELRDAGYLPEAVATTSRCSAPASTPRRSTSRARSWRGGCGSSAISKSPAVFDEQKLRHMNGRYLRELPVEELTRAARGVHRARGAARRRRDQPREDPDARRLLAARRLPLRRAGRRPGGVGEDDRRRGRRRGARRPRARRSRGARAVHAGGRRGGAARRRRGARLEAEAGLPAGARRDRRHDGLAGDLRERRAARARRDAAAHRRGARAPSASAAALAAPSWRPARRQWAEDPKPVGLAADKESGSRAPASDPLARQRGIYDRMTPPLDCQPPTACRSEQPVPPSPRWRGTTTRATAAA